ncbi:MAG: hypothetical protein AABW90_01605 [Nanoarchaeota archaeon]
MKNYRVILTSKDSIVNRTYKKRGVGGHYINIDRSEEKGLLEGIANKNEEIIRSFGLDKLKIKLEITIYQF